MRTGAAMMRFGSNLYLTELIMVTLLLLGLIVVRSIGPAGEGGRLMFQLSKQIEARCMPSVASATSASTWS